MSINTNSSKNNNIDAQISCCFSGKIYVNSSWNKSTKTCDFQGKEKIEIFFLLLHTFVIQGREVSIVELIKFASYSVNFKKIWTEIDSIVHANRKSMKKGTKKIYISQIFISKSRRTFMYFYPKDSSNKKAFVPSVSSIHIVISYVIDWILQRSTR